MLKLLVCALLGGASVWANVTVSPFPRPKPIHLSSSQVTKEGVLENGKMKLSIPLDDAFYYQRDNKEQILPLLDYLTNEYPEVNFTNLRFKKIMVVATAGSENANLSFMSTNGDELKSNFVPRVADPTVVFGEYSQLTIEGRELTKPLSYISISGALWINNIIIEMEVGTPNYSLAPLPLEGRSVGNLTGVIRPSFDEERYNLVYSMVMAMSSPSTNTMQTNSNWNSYVAPTTRVEPAVVEISKTIRIGRISRDSGKLNVKINHGYAQIKGLSVRFSNGRTHFFNMPYQFPIGKNSVDLVLDRSYAGAEVTVVFENAIPGTDIDLDFRQ